MGYLRMMLPRPFVDDAFTRAIIRKLGPWAALCLVRIWEHCQVDQKGPQWKACDSLKFETVAGWEGEPGQFFKACVEFGWIKSSGKTVVILRWAEINHQLIHCWDAGRKGGFRRHKSQVPVGNSNENHMVGQKVQEPYGSHLSTDLIRSDQGGKGGNPPFKTPLRQTDRVAPPPGTRKRERMLREQRERYGYLRAQFRELSKFRERTPDQAKLLAEVESELKAISANQRKGEV